MNLCLSLRTIATGIICLLAVAWQRPAPAQTKPIVWKVQASFPSASLLYENLRMFAERVEKMSAGRLKIEPLPSGAIVGAFEVLDATHRGVLEGAHTCAYYYLGKHRAAALFTDVPGGPYGMNTVDYWGWMYEGGGWDLLQAFYRDVIRMNVVALPIFPTTPQALGWFKKPLTRAEDMKGLKYRVAGIAAEVYKEMGVAVVTLPGAEVLPAGERGVLDATEWYSPAEDIKLGFYDVWKFYHYPGSHETAGACELDVNKDVWNRLAPDLQEIVKSAAMEVAFRSLLAFNRLDAEALRNLQEKQGVTLVQTPEDILLEHLKAWDKIAQQESAKDAFFAKVLASQRNYAALVVPARRFMDPYETIGKYYWRK
jgi:TRAP-type mannitol/chloroaromatic compound transport system substrate-binding protein